MEPINVDELFRQTAEKNIATLAGSLIREMEMNEAQTRPERKVHTSTLVVGDDGGFIALDGSAHRMEKCFTELFKRRPELRSVVQSVLDKMFYIADL